MAPQVWLITGASSGFGALLAEAALKAGHRVIATARNPTKAAKDYPQVTALGGTWLPLDVTSKQTTLQVAQAIQDHGGRIDVVINNAGYGLVGSIEDISEDELDVQFQTNVYGVVRVTKAVLPLMRAQRQGTIVNISSIAGFTAGPSSAAYAMTKFAVEALSEALSTELDPFNIRILLVEPGAFRTNFIGSHRTPAAGLNEGYKDTPLAAAMGKWETFAGKQSGDPSKAVQRILDVIQLQGQGQGKEHLLRLPLGTDCFPRMVEKLESVKQNLEEMKEIALSTDVDDE
ncbi:putative short chain oxidoreductase/dehydrogenase [Aspergillus fijiensis CBS 313.89]|uniref:Putative short chain oxidoreductase/dehydrogenase n=1 Tax=Aspergillus fijiensis CBS 313.89 TaxID=1448319 RepID=A0A8G1S1W4_9EURO|nr:putative short chain oxidoreductase/dehydrogenase [Aspergillus fijiensis CBS 313.89]RAK81896.1 putative short chain oxidoreductase/dehydrogenase [Aspergillus fijiensis CBS 313.89]